MPRPAFGVSEAARLLSERSRKAVHHRQVIVLALRGVEPLALRSVAGKRSALGFLNACGVDEEFRSHWFAQRCALAVGHSVVDDTGIEGEFALWTRSVVLHPTREYSRDRKPRRDHMIFHVILKWVCEDPVSYTHLRAH